MSTKNSPKRSLDIGQKQSLNMSDADKASNFEALHEKISGTEERLNDINEQTQKKFQISIKIMDIFHLQLMNFYMLEIKFVLKIKNMKQIYILFLN